MKLVFEMILFVFLAVQVGSFLLCLVTGIKDKLNGFRIFHWDYPSLGEILLALLLLPSFLLLLIIDYTPDILAYKPFSKDK